jgi:hypothetical protein
MQLFSFDPSDPGACAVCKHKTVFYKPLEAKNGGALMIPPAHVIVDHIWSQDAASPETCSQSAANKRKGGLRSTVSSVPTYSST